MFILNSLNIFKELRGAIYDDIMIQIKNNHFNCLVE